MNLVEVEVIGTMSDDGSTGYRIDSRATRWINLDAVTKLEPAGSNVTIVWLGSRRNVYCEGVPAEVAKRLKQIDRENE